MGAGLGRNVGIAYSTPPSYWWDLPCGQEVTFSLCRRIIDSRIYCMIGILGFYLADLTAKWDDDHWKTILAASGRACV